MGIIPTTKQYEQMKLTLLFLLGVCMLVLGFYGMWKYPIPTHYYDNINHPAGHYSTIALFPLEEVPECGNDIYHWLNTPNQWRFHDHV